MEKNDSLKAIIAGAGPAGLTAAYEMLQHTNIHPIVFEESGEIGGISKTVNYKGNRIDIGGHRFFSKNDEIMQWWQEIMPVFENPATPESPVPDKVMLVRQRVSRIFYLHHFFDYPISVKLKTFTNMGFKRTMKAGVGYIYSSVFKKEETSLENFYINRFGKPLYQMFFEDYTEKVWGVHPSRLGADWGSQRVKGLSVAAILKDIFAKQFRRKGEISQKGTETSLIEKFIYPKLGPGQFWETVAEQVTGQSGEVNLHSKVVKIHLKNGRVYAADIEKDGRTATISCDYLLSSMPLKDLVGCLEGIEIPEEVRKIASELPYRDFITVGLLVSKLAIKSPSPENPLIPDTWIYIQERDVKIGRLQIFNNWSPYLVKNAGETVWLGLEYFCTENDAMWNMDKQAFINLAINELEKIGFIGKKDVLDSTQIKVRKAYPSYFGSYYQLDRVKAFLDKIENLYCIGRNGQHRYNNMDHSMLTAMEAVRNIKNGKKTKENIWNVNTEEEYHEAK